MIKGVALRLYVAHIQPLSLKDSDVFSYIYKGPGTLELSFLFYRWENFSKEMVKDGPGKKLTAWAQGLLESLLQTLPQGCSDTRELMPDRRKNTPGLPGRRHFHPPMTTSRSKCTRMMEAQQQPRGSTFLSRSSWCQWPTLKALILYTFHCPSSRNGVQSP